MTEEPNPNYNPDGSPKPGLFIRTFAKITAVCLLIASPILASAILDRKDGKNRGGD